MSETIIEFHNACTSPGPWYDVSADDVTFGLAKGELALIRFDRHAPRLPIADMAMGLVELESGEVGFLGKSWAERSANEAADCRGEIGRLFSATGWVHHLDVDENITLRLRHHTNRSLGDIENEAASLARVFGLRDGMPRTRPGNLGLHDLQRAACVRMLAGSPRLIVLDEDSEGFFPDVLEVLIPQIQIARLAGAVVIWMSTDPEVHSTRAIRPTFSKNVNEMSSRHHAMAIATKTE